MIVWSGFGFLALIILGIGAAIGTGLGQGVGLAEGYGIALGLLIGAAANWFAGVKMNDPSGDRELVDPKTGARVMLRRRHTLFWIPMQWWSALAVAFAIFFAYQQATGAFSSGRRSPAAPASAPQKS